MPFSLRPAFLALCALMPLATPLGAETAAGSYLAARAATAANDYRAAIGLYDAALDANPGVPELMDGAILAQIGAGNVAKAAELARVFVAAGGKSQQSHLAIMAEKALAGDFAGIIADGKAGDTASGNGALFDDLVQAWAELGSGEMTLALAGFDKIAKTPGLEFFGHYNKALALASAGDFEGAEAILSGNSGVSLQSDRRGVLARVQVLSQLERNPDAIKLLEKNFGRGQDPGVDDLIARLEAGEPLPFDIVRNATDGLAEVFYMLGAALSGDADDAYVLLYGRITTRLRPGHVDATLLTAEQLEKLGQHDLASAVYAEIKADDPAYYIAEIGRAAATRAAGRPEAAIEILQALARSHGQIVTVQNALGDALRRDERYAEAVKAYDTALSMIPTPTRAQWALFYARGICHERLDHWDLAVADFRRSLELDPEQPQVLNYLGYSFVEKGENLEEALSMIQRAVAARPDAGYILDSLAWAYYQMGRFDEALQPMERASLLEPVDAVVTDHLGDVYWQVGRTREAEFQWHRALSFEPAEAEALRIKAKLAKGLDAVLADEAAQVPKATEVTKESGDGN